MAFLAAVGVEITQSEFDEADFVEFARRLRQQLAVLRELLYSDDFGAGPVTIGAETELHLVDDLQRPIGVNRQVLADCQNQNLTLEVDRFNVEINAPPHALAGAPFGKLRRDLEMTLADLQRAAAAHQARAVSIGILPTLRMEDFNSGALTDNHRYRALSAGIRRIRHENFTVEIDGRQSLRAQCPDVVFEGANTSFQLHLRVAASEFAAAYNAAQIATGIVLAVAGNSPFFLDHDLWDETRIALFRQAVDDRTSQGAPADASQDWRPARVSFGHGWVRRGAFELFAEAVRMHEPLIPVLAEDRQQDAGAPALSELRLHEGTIWRWNRAVYDPIDNGHLRIEMRSLPSGPTVVDMMANAAFLIGLSLDLRGEVEELLHSMTFGHARRNFYESARHGLGAQLLWPSSSAASPGLQPAPQLIEAMLPRAERGLRQAGVDVAECSQNLGVIANRLASGQTGAVWQRAAWQRLQARGERQSLAQMLGCYIERSAAGGAVHSWSLP
ncbi:MAG: hypothetical protein K1X75_17930 [Leptospirales bacterium]|nr:hypothetical protein [Leptospirales bacterium]